MNGNTRQIQQIMVGILHDYKDTPPDIIKHNVINAIKNSPYSVVELAQKLNIKEGTVYSWYRKKSKYGISFDVILNIADILGLDVDELLNPIEERDVN